ncbi:uncharacterized protein FYW61_005853 [Anableps anableps]
MTPASELLSEGLNGTLFPEKRWSEEEKWLLVAVLGAEMLMGVVGNSVVLMVKVMCRGQFCCRYWLPFISLTMSDLGCSLLITSGSMMAALTGGQRSPWCEVVSLLKFAFITSSIGSIDSPMSKRRDRRRFQMYDSAEMLCAVFWESSYSDMMTYILCAFSICIFLPFLLMFICSVRIVVSCRSSNSDEEADLSEVAPLLVASYMICYTPFFMSELILLGRMDLTPAPDWLRTLSSVMSYLDCCLNPLIYFSHQNFREAGLALLWTRKPRKPVLEPVLTAITKTDLRK